MREKVLLQTLRRLGAIHEHMPVVSDCDFHVGLSIPNEIVELVDSHHGFSPVLPLDRHVRHEQWTDDRCEEKLMKKPVCQDDCEAYRLFGTPDELMLEGFEADLYELAPGVVAWQAIAFALDRNLELPYWVKSYLLSVADGISEWDALNEHPSKLKEILGLKGKRKFANPANDPRCVYDAICELKKAEPRASIISLAKRLAKMNPQYAELDDTEQVRQKYYQGRKLASTGKDFKGRGRKSDVPRFGYLATSSFDEEEISFLQKSS